MMSTRSAVADVFANRLAKYLGHSSRLALFLLVLASSVSAQNISASENIQSMRALAEHGDLQAQLWLFVAFEKGKGVDRNTSEALRWLRMAAEQGSPTAAAVLAQKYLTADGVQKNIEEGVRWDQKAAAAGIDSAQYNLGIAYESGEGGLPVDLATAVGWFQRAANQGFALAQFKIAEYTFFGQAGIIPKNPVLALLWSNLAEASTQDADLKTKIVQLRRKIYARTDSAQLLEASRLTQAWKPQKEPETAAIDTAAQSLRERPPVTTTAQPPERKLPITKDSDPPARSIGDSALVLHRRLVSSGRIESRSAVLPGTPETTWQQIANAVVNPDDCELNFQITDPRGTGSLTYFLESINSVETVTEQEAWNRTMRTREQQRPIVFFGSNYSVVINGNMTRLLFSSLADANWVAETLRDVVAPCRQRVVSLRKLPGYRSLGDILSGTVETLNAQGRLSMEIFFQGHRGESPIFDSHMISHAIADELTCRMRFDDDRQADHQTFVVSFRRFKNLDIHTMEETMNKVEHTGFLVRSDPNPYRLLLTLQGSKSEFTETIQLYIVKKSDAEQLAKNIRQAAYLCGASISNPQ